jgi:hypothetical protein
MPLDTQKADYGEMVVIQRIMQIISAFILGVLLIAGTLFFSQEGFGGGHGHFDFILYVLAFPWIFLPWPEAVWIKGDYLPD